MKRLLVLLAACHTAPPKPISAVPEIAPQADSELDKRRRLIAELQDDILASYERDEPPDVETQMILPQVGPARIGAGPGDVLYADELSRAPSRWPLRLAAGTQATVRSKRLDIHLAADKQVSAAWMSDELSWRITMCGHTAVIPLRITALYAHDGDRWVPVFEHLSFAQVPVPQTDASGALLGKPIANAQLSQDFTDTLSSSLSPVLYHNAAMAQFVSLDPEHRAEEDPRQPAPTLLLAPDPDGEWHGDQDVATAQLVDGPLRSEDRRVGTVGFDPARATIAYWVGNFDADMPARPGIQAGKVRLRGTFVFEKRADRWIVVQGHLSEPIYDNDLASRVFGTALDSDMQREPLRLNCDDGSR